LRAKGGGFAFFGAGAGAVRLAGAFDVLSAESLERSEGVVPAGEERIGRARAAGVARAADAGVAGGAGLDARDLGATGATAAAGLTASGLVGAAFREVFAGPWARAGDGAAIAAPTPCPVRLVLDLIALSPRSAVRDGFFTAWHSELQEVRREGRLRG